jgi:hypothetical protein
MRILAHVHTFNDSEVIDRALEAIRRQTRLPTPSLWWIMLRRMGPSTESSRKMSLSFATRPIWAWAERLESVLPARWSRNSSGPGCSTLTAFPSLMRSRNCLNFSSACRRRKRSRSTFWRPDSGRAMAVAGHVPRLVWSADCCRTFCSRGSQPV